MKDPRKIKTILVLDWDETLATGRLKEYIFPILSQHQKRINGGGYDIFSAKCTWFDGKTTEYHVLHPLFLALLIMYIKESEHLALALITNSIFEKAEIAKFINGLLIDKFNDGTISEYDSQLDDTRFQSDFQFEPVALKKLVHSALKKKLSEQLFSEEDFVFRNRYAATHGLIKSNRIFDVVKELVSPEMMQSRIYEPLEIIFFDNDPQYLEDAVQNLRHLAASQYYKLNVSIVLAEHFFRVAPEEKKTTNLFLRRDRGFAKLIELAQKVGLPVARGNSVR